MTVQREFARAVFLPLLASTIITLAYSIDDLPNSNTISIRATRLSSVSNFSTQQEEFALYPDLKFICDATITKWWFIGLPINDDGTSISRAMIQRTSLIVTYPEATSDGGTQYVQELPVTANTLSTLPTDITLFESNVEVPVRTNGTIVIVQPPSESSLRFEMLYGAGKGPTGYFRQDRLVDGNSRVNIYTTTSEGTTEAMDYPMLAIETRPPNCTSGFLSLTILQSLLARTFTPSISEMRFIPTLNFTCGVTVTSWTMGGIAPPNSNELMFRISIWEVENDRYIYRRELPIDNPIMETDEQNVYTFTSMVDNFQEGWFLAISQSPSSGFLLHYLEGGEHLNYFVNQPPISDSVFEFRADFTISDQKHERRVALPLLTPTVDSSHNCVSNFINKQTLIDRALLIPNITFAPGQQAPAETTTTSGGEPPTDGNGRTFTTNTNKGALSPSQDNPQIDSARIYVLCDDPFETGGVIESWTFAARKQPQNATSPSTVLRSEIVAMYPQLLILSTSNPTPCSKNTFERVSSTTMSSIPPIKLESINVYNFTMSTPLVYSSGDVLGIYQPSARNASLLMAFDNIIDSSSGSLALRFDTSASVIPQTLIADADGVTSSMLRIQPLMNISFSSNSEEVTTPNEIEVLPTTMPETEARPTTMPETEARPTTMPETEARPTTMPETEARPTAMPEIDDDDTDTTDTLSMSTSETTAMDTSTIASSQIDDSTTIGIAAGIGAAAVLLVLLVIIMLIVFIIMRRKRMYKMSDKDIPLSPIRNLNVSEEIAEQALGNPIYAEATESNKARAMEYEVPLTSLAQTQERGNGQLNQDLGQSYETPISTLSSKSPQDKGAHHYHVLEARNKKEGETEEYFEIYVPAGDYRRALTDVSQQPVNIYATLTESKFSSMKSDGSYFVECEEFWRPASDQEQLYHQLSANKYREISRHLVKVTEKLGSGAFGEVSKGTWTKSKDSESVQVAVKQLKSNAPVEDRVKFLQEAAIMGQFRHPNVIMLMGVVTLGDPVMIILELMANGDLRSFLNKQKPKISKEDSSDWPQALLKYCQHVAAGMDYLHKKGFIHRDLAARNILVAADSTCKISDFGLSRDLEDEDYYVSKGGLIPVKWTAPEALNFKKYSPPCDIWSYGIVMYEIWSIGNRPYRKIKNHEVLPKVEGGYRMPPPPGCSREVYRIMIQCWHPEGSCRPSFSEVLESLLQPQNELLHWSAEDEAVHPEASKLAAGLTAGDLLYQELQNTYISTYETAKKT